MGYLLKEISSQNNRENTNETYNLSLKIGLLQLGLTWSMYENESLKNDTPINYKAITCV